MSNAAHVDKEGDDNDDTDDVLAADDNAVGDDNGVGAGEVIGTAHDGDCVAEGIEITPSSARNLSTDGSSCTGKVLAFSSKTTTSRNALAQVANDSTVTAVEEHVGVVGTQSFAMESTDDLACIFLGVPQDVAKTWGARSRDCNSLCCTCAVYNVGRST